MKNWIFFNKKLITNCGIDPLKFLVQVLLFFEKLNLNLIAKNKGLVDLENIMVLYAFFLIEE
jgi:hypothetical protein